MQTAQTLKDVTDKSHMNTKNFYLSMKREKWQIKSREKMGNEKDQRPEEKQKISGHIRSHQQVPGMRKQVIRDVPAARNMETNWKAQGWKEFRGPVIPGTDEDAQQQETPPAEGGGGPLGTEREAHAPRLSGATPASHPAETCRRPRRHTWASRAVVSDWRGEMVKVPHVHWQRSG